MKKTIAIILMIVMTMTPITIQAKTVNRYTTQTVALKDKAKGKTIIKVKANTKLIVKKSGKVWVRAVYKGKECSVKKKYLNAKRSQKKYAGSYLRRAGVIRWQGKKFTWYSQRAMPGRGLRIPGRHVDKNGYVCDKDGYIVVGSSVSNKRKRVITPTPFGKFGKTYDCGAVGSKHFDVYVAW